MHYCQYTVQYVGSVILGIVYTVYVRVDNDMPALSNITVFLISQICYTFFYYYCAILIYFNVRSTHFMLFSSYILSNSVPCSVQYVHMSVSLLINNFNNDLVDLHIFSRLFNIMRICVLLF